jgi:hypothetical protein
MNETDWTSEFFIRMKMSKLPENIFTANEW